MAVKTRRLRDIPLAFAMLGPSLLVLLTFVLYPLGKAVWLDNKRAMCRERIANRLAGANTPLS